MPVTFDVAVIGGGITGVAAALAARQRGAATCLVRAAPGCTAMISGAWSGPLRSELQESLAAAGYPLVRTDEPIAHQRGATLRCDFAGPTHAAATVAGETLVCGIAGLPGFHAQTLARLWQAEHLLVADTITLPDTPATGWTPVSLAAHIERSPGLLLEQLHKHRTARIILPAVLGIEATESITARFAAEGIRVGEALATTPSLPGWRLWHALERVITAHEITCFDGRAVLDTASNRQVKSLRVNDQTILARSFVLATGKFAAGGVVAGDEFQETVFDIPIWQQQLGDVFTVPDPLPLTDPVRTETQPLLRAGVQTDAMLRPVNRAQDVVYQNVFVAGTIRAGWNVADSGLGRCAEDGWTAGLNAAA
jgi:glycerol-3-phosphate dehydrogenase subunit B